ncbi:sensor histidine kinase [Tumebacillus permanentifrigoris]|uniref:histidine kinase n=1 Tax=Tumebacillus permanentifrigoris TaxID=378543 RepID=A0A316D787_9BACL|nr:ATP-binding protein [Tumebacillus permanentifrigoris]PWK08354.1 phospho-acceptor domain-containing protein [Tumebacillus permanentifrigoris]
MFQKIRVQLVTLNAAVLLILLLVSGMALYLFLEHRLLERVDDGLRDMQLVAVQQMPDRLVVRPNGRTLDMPMVTIVYDNQGGVVQQAPDSQFVNGDLEALRDLKISDVPQSIKLDGHSYRVLTALAPSVQVTQANPFFPAGLDVTNVQRTLQVVRNIDAEEDVLSTLLVVIVTGTLLGAALTVGAGFFLAGRALVPIRQAWERQQQFVADASHELRTPLAVVQSHSELMLRHPTETVQEQSRNVAVVLKETKRMTKLVSDLLTLARTDSNQLLIEGRALRLDEVVRDVTEDYRLMAELQEMELHTQIHGHLELIGDENRIRQLLVILLDNALKYTMEGGSIEVICRQIGPALELKVSDTGIGIAPDDLPRIFDRFYRGDKARTRAEGGSGLGLSIAQWIVEAHHGKIRAESTLHRGTTVTVSLPTKS